MITKYTIIHPDGREETGSVNWPNAPGFGAMKKLLAPIIGGDIERVNVFWEDKYTDMFVDEIGLRKGLQKNERATTIYWNNTLTHLKDAVQGDTCIVGIAVLFERRVWY